MYKVAILISGTGSNMKSIIDHQLNMKRNYEITGGNIPYKVTKVISDRPAKGLTTAELYGISTLELDRKHPDYIDFLDKALNEVDILVLAGYLSILPESIIEKFNNRIINIHPSLLPKYGGIGMYGLKVHEKVIENKETVSGCTVHIVTKDVDQGKILIQKKVAVHEDDTPQKLQDKILPLEHQSIVEGLLELIKDMGDKYMKTALISVYDKTGVVKLAEFLKNNGWKIVSSGGTYQYLKENQIDVAKVEDITGAPEILDGRVKTLHPKIHGGILARRDIKAHMETLKNENINTIDLVCVNLYPFEEKLKENLSFEEMIEFIDIGGPSMLRSAAKNFKDVFILSNPSQYEEFMGKKVDEDLKSYRAKLAVEVFKLTSNYDKEIAKYLEHSLFEEETFLDLNEDTLNLELTKVKDLKYGENPHQKSAFYKLDGINGFMTDFEQLNGNEMGHINYKDLESAWRIVCDFDEVACSAIKHNTPCGVALGNTPLEAYEKAFECDPISIFGGIVAINREIDVDCARKMSEIMLHIIAAPSFTDEALEVLKKKKNLLIIKMNSQPSGNKSIISCDGGILIQDDDVELYEYFEVVTEKKPSEEEKEELKFAMQVVKFVKSNAIVASKNKMAVGIGGGFVNRIDAAEYALSNTSGPLVLASDAFFPFDDVVRLARKMGVTAIIQPGGSVNDKLSIDRCNDLGISMVFTGMRHFRH